MKSWIRAQDSAPQAQNKVVQQSVQNKLKSDWTPTPSDPASGTTCKPWDVCGFNQVCQCVSHRLWVSSFKHHTYCHCLILRTYGHVPLKRKVLNCPAKNTVPKLAAVSLADVSFLLCLWLQWGPIVTRHVAVALPWSLVFHAYDIHSQHHFNFQSDSRVSNLVKAYWNFPNYQTAAWKKLLTM